MACVAYGSGTLEAVSVPKVSIVVPTFNRASLLRGVVEGLLQQTLIDIEILVMDDGSPDETPQVMAAFTDPRVRYDRRNHLGVPGIVNAGLEQARGDYVMTCHDHDFYEPEMLEEMANVLNRHPTVGFVHCGVRVVDPQGKHIVEQYLRPYPEFMLGKLFLVKELLPNLDSRVTALTMVRRSAFSGRFLDPTFGPCADVELWMRLSDTWDVGYCPKPLINIRQRDQTSTYFGVGTHLTYLALAAKKCYLDRAEDPIERQGIARSWRKGADRSALYWLWLALAARLDQELSSILAFVEREGSFLGTLAIKILCYMPRPVSLGLLRSLRLMSRTARHLSCRLGINAS